MLNILFLLTSCARDKCREDTVIHNYKELERITPAQLSKVKFLNIPHQNISNIYLLADTKNLEYLNIVGNPITDYTPLLKLQKLKYLHADFENIKNCSLLYSNQTIYNLCKEYKVHHAPTEYRRATKLKDDQQQEAQKLLIENGDEYEFIENKKFKYGYIGHGLAGNVYLVREKATDIIWAAKFPISNDMLNEVLADYDNAQTISDITGVEYKVKKYHDFVIKTYVKGETFKDWVKNNKLFNESQESIDALNSLKVFLKNIIKNKSVFYDLSPTNFMYDEIKKEWIIIDTVAIRSFNTKNEASQIFNSLYCTRHGD